MGVDPTGMETLGQTLGRVITVGLYIVAIFDLATKIFQDLDIEAFGRGLQEMLKGLDLAATLNTLSAIFDSYKLMYDNMKNKGLDWGDVLKDTLIGGGVGAVIAVVVLLIGIPVASLVPFFALGGLAIVGLAALGGALEGGLSSALENLLGQLWDKLLNK